MRLSFVLSLAIWCAATPNLRAQARSDATPASDDPDLAALRSAYLEAYNGGDAAAMEALYVEDAVRMPYDAQAQNGREAILAYYRASFERRAFDPELTFAVDQVVLRGDLALERGRYREELHPKNGGRTLLEEGKYVLMARRSGPGAPWRYAWSIFNRDAPAAPLPGG